MTKSAFVAIVGRPNVGKSSLLNALLGEKIAIVSDKPQTTRTRITGVLTQGETQFVFIDTPGLHRPRTKLSEYMVQQVRESVADVDVAVLVTEAFGKITNAERELAENLKSQHIPVLLVPNKIDLLQDKEQLLPKIAEFSALLPLDEVVPISVKEGDGVQTLLALLDKYALEGPHFFPDDTLTDQPERVIVAETIREKILLHMREEIPHGVAVSVESMKLREEQNLWDIHATILCEKASHKGMIIGKGGAMLKTIASEARADLEGFLNARINLQCWVKVREDWRNQERVIRDLGFR